MERLVLPTVSSTALTPYEAPVEASKKVNWLIANADKAPFEMVQRLVMELQPHCRHPGGMIKGHSSPRLTGPCPELGIDIDYNLVIQRSFYDLDILVAAALNPSRLAISEQKTLDEDQARIARRIFEYREKGLGPGFYHPAFEARLEPSSELRISAAVFGSFFLIFSPRYVPPSVDNREFSGSLKIRDDGSGKLKIWPPEECKGPFSYPILTSDQIRQFRSFDVRPGDGTGSTCHARLDATGRILTVNNLGPGAAYLGFRHNEYFDAQQRIGKYARPLP